MRKALLASVVVPFALLTPVVHGAVSNSVPKADITPRVDCVMRTNLGFVAYFTYSAHFPPDADGVDRGFTIPAGRQTAFTANFLFSVVSLSESGPIMEPGISHFVTSNNEYGFSAYFRADKLLRWVVKLPEQDGKVAEASARSPACPGVAGKAGPQGDGGQNNSAGHRSAGAHGPHKRAYGRATSRSHRALRRSTGLRRSSMDSERRSVRPSTRPRG